MKSLLTFFFLSITVLSFSQEKKEIEIPLGCWTDSKEESTNEFKIFRPCDYKNFPVSRFRFRMVLKENQKCKWYYLAPNDAHRMRPGSWEYNKETKELTIYNESGSAINRLKITEIKEDRLIIKKD